MSNMSYCRFRNALEDLRDCVEHMDDKTGVDEWWARISLVKLCGRIAADYLDDNDETPWETK